MCGLQASSHLQNSLQRGKGACAKSGRGCRAVGRCGNCNSRDCSDRCDCRACRDCGGHRGEARGRGWIASCVLAQLASEADLRLGEADVTVRPPPNFGRVITFPVHKMAPRNLETKARASCLMLSPHKGSCAIYFHPGVTVRSELCNICFNSLDSGPLLRETKQRLFSQWFKHA